jgi:hypothetical protein
VIGLDPVEPTCSRAGCRAAAAWSIRWRNPKIHAPERRKVWLACDEHVAYLRDFLGSRGFPLEVVEGVAS